MKNKSFVFFMTIVLGGSLLIICSSQSPANGKQQGELNFDPCQPRTVPESESGTLFTNDSNFPVRADYQTDGRELYFRAILAVLFVVILGVAAIYVSKKLLPKIANLPGKEIHIVETVHLGPRKAVHVLEIGNRRFLIGSTNENITKLADITGGLTDLGMQEADLK